MNAFASRRGRLVALRHGALSPRVGSRYPRHRPAAWPDRHPRARGKELRGRDVWLPERSAPVKKQAGINGLLPTLRVGPFHLFRLHLDLRSTF
jgi:hypothetical protein